MLTQSQHRRIARKCERTFSYAISRLPRFLADCEPEAAAAIVAGLIKSYMSDPVPESDPGAALAEVLRIAREAPQQDPAPIEVACPPVSQESQNSEPEYPKSYELPEPKAQTPAPNHPTDASPSRHPVQSEEEELDLPPDTPNGEHGMWARPTRTGSW